MRSLRWMLLLMCSCVAAMPANAAGPKPVTERQLLCWIVAELPTFNLQYELQTHGVDFAIDQSWRESLKRAGVSTQLLAVLAKAPAPSGSPAPRDEFADRLLRVVQEVNSRKFAAAQMHLRTLVKLAKTDPDLQLALGWVTGKHDDDWGEAVSAFSDAVRLAPESAYAHQRLSYACARIGSGDLAVKEGKAAVELRPADADGHKYLGLAFVSRGDYERADAEFQEALKLGPDYANVYHDIGISLEKQGQYRKAIEAYQKAIALDATRWDFFYNLGISANHAHLADEAIQAYKHAKDLAPDELVVRQNLGAAYCNSGKYQEAVDEFEELLAMEPNWNMARVCLYKSLLKLGRVEEAKQVKADYDKLESAVE